MDQAKVMGVGKIPIQAKIREYFNISDTSELVFMHNKTSFSIISLQLLGVSNLHPSQAHFLGKKISLVRQKSEN